MARIRDLVPVLPLVVLLVLCQAACSTSRVVHTNQEENGRASAPLAVNNSISMNGSNWKQQLDQSNANGLVYYMAGYRTPKRRRDGYYGFTATMDVYSLSLGPGQISSSGSVWITDDRDDVKSSSESTDSIRIGWHVTQGDTRPNFLIRWTNKTSRSFDQTCPGFQRESGASMVPGGIIDSVSQLNGTKQSITLKVLKDKGVSGDWLVHYGLNREPELIGRFPKSIFTSMAEKGTNIWFVGMVITDVTFQPPPAPTPMGSGYMADVNNSFVASMSNLQLIDQHGQGFHVGRDLVGYSTNQHLYTFTHIDDGRFFYGGPVGPKNSGVKSCYPIFLVLLFGCWLFII